MLSHTAAECPACHRCGRTMLDWLPDASGRPEREGWRWAVKLTHMAGRWWCQRCRPELHQRER